MLGNVVCLHTGRRTPLAWTRDWKVRGSPARVDVFRETEAFAPRPASAFEVYCPDEADAARWASVYEDRGYVTRVVMRGE
jgi:hypothetical protein